MSKLGRLIRMSGADRRLLAEAWLCLAAVRLALWVLPYREVRRVVLERANGSAGARRAQQAPAPTKASSKEGARAPMVTQPGQEDRRVERVVWAVGVGARYVPRATCLTRALAVQWLLADPRAALRVGVQKGSRGELEAHAWLEFDGQVVVGAEEAAAFVPLPPLPGETL